MKTGTKILIGAIVLGVGGYMVYRACRIGMSREGLSFLKNEEGYRLSVYPDSRGIPTGGTGHKITTKDLTALNATLNNVIGKKISPELAASWLKYDLDRFEKVVRDSIKVPIKKFQRDALISLAFNIGESAFKKSSLAKKINTGKASPLDIIIGFSQHDDPSELIDRRAVEARLFLTGNYSNTITSSEVSTYYRLAA